MKMNVPVTATMGTLGNPFMASNLRISEVAAKPLITGITTSYWDKYIINQSSTTNGRKCTIKMTENWRRRPFDPEEDANRFTESTASAPLHAVSHYTTTPQLLTKKKKKKKKK
jgi:hypothetical protein